MGVEIRGEGRVRFGVWGLGVVKGLGVVRGLVVGFIKNLDWGKWACLIRADEARKAQGRPAADRGHLVSHTVF